MHWKHCPHSYGFLHTDFTEDEHSKFLKRHEEGYDLQGDCRYNLWKEWRKSHSGKHYAIRCIQLPLKFLPTTVRIIIGVEPAHNPGHIRQLFGTIVSDKPLHHLRKQPKPSKGKRKNMKKVCQLCTDNPVDDVAWIQCDLCSQWSHCQCVQLSKAEADDMEHFACPAGCTWTLYSQFFPFHNFK